MATIDVDDTTLYYERTGRGFAHAVSVFATELDRLSSGSTAAVTR
jgi:hypothetical protein